MFVDFFDVYFFLKESNASCRNLGQGTLEYTTFRLQNTLMTKFRSQPHWMDVDEAIETLRQYMRERTTLQENEMLELLGHLNGKRHSHAIDCIGETGMTYAVMTDLIHMVNDWKKKHKLPVPLLIITALGI